MHLLSRAKPDTFGDVPQTLAPLSSEQDSTRRSDTRTKEYQRLRHIHGS
jgi:hypothetical protein